MVVPSPSQTRLMISTGRLAPPETPTAIFFAIRFAFDTVVERSHQPQPHRRHAGREGDDLFFIRPMACAASNRVSRSRFAPSRIPACTWTVASKVRNNGRGRAWVSLAGMIALSAHLCDDCLKTGGFSTFAMPRYSEANRARYRGIGLDHEELFAPPGLLAAGVRLTAEARSGASSNSK